MDKRPTATLANTPWWMWFNLISLDAVAVGCCWVVVFTREFIDRWPQPYELGVIGLSIWLVYTADRLFDALQLDPTKPHTHRHQFHADHQIWLSVLWLAALVLNVALIVRCASESQLRVGFIAVAAAITYVASVQWTQPLCSSRIAKAIPKEVRAGIVFSFGVSLVAWSEIAELGDTGAVLPKLLIANVLAAILFTANCFAIAFWETHLDTAQGFSAFPSLVAHPRKRLVQLLVIHLAVAGGLFYVDRLPPLLTASLVVSDLAMLMLVSFVRRDVNSPAGLLADLILVAAPAFCLIVGATGW
ncbi:MAG: hypothetical protein AAFV88_21650 [Planctomycetota bacterium]